MIYFSVIIPHFTKSDTLLLERAVASVPDREDIEVLVVDNSPNKIDRHLFNHRSNVRILFSDNTKGCGHARNVGMEQAKGVWMLFLDADDFFTERAFQVFDSYRDAKFDVIFFKMTSCYSDTLKPAHRHELYIEKIDKFLKDGDEYALRYRWSPAWSRMVKAILVKTNDMWWEEVPASEDLVFSAKLGIVAKSIYADAAEVYCVTVTQGSITNTRSFKNIESMFDVRIRKNNLLRKHGLNRNTSVMYLIIQSLRFGIRPFLKLFYKALITGNLFVGCQNWFRTTLKISRQALNERRLNPRIK